MIETPKYGALLYRLSPVVGAREGLQYTRHVVGAVQAHPLD